MRRSNAAYSRSQLGGTIGEEALELLTGPRNLAEALLDVLLTTSFLAAAARRLASLPQWASQLTPFVAWTQRSRWWCRFMFRGLA